MGKLMLWAAAFATLFAGCNEVRFEGEDPCEALGEVACFDAKDQGCMLDYEGCGAFSGCRSACTNDADCAGGFSCEEHTFSSGACSAVILDAHPELNCVQGCTDHDSRACIPD